MTVATAQQLKALVRGLSKGDSGKAQVIMSSYATERFLERVVQSPYRSNLILKGGVLVAAMVGLDNRSTMDIDTTVKNLPLSGDTIKGMVEEIIAISLDDNMSFEVKSVRTILEGADYPGIRVMMEAALGRIRIPMKLDFSTDEVITPSEITYSMKLLFEDRTISILAYNGETIFAEKMQSIIARGIANTRMRDFYDVYALESLCSPFIDADILRQAFSNTSAKRGTSVDYGVLSATLEKVGTNPEMAKRWEAYRKKYDYANSLAWIEVMEAVNRIFSIVRAEHPTQVS